MKKVYIILALSALIYACGQNNDADMYEASEMAELMREMVDFSKETRQKLMDGDSAITVPAAFYEMKAMQATRDEQKDQEFQAMADVYLQTLKGLESGQATAEYYQASIKACQTCHSTYCGGPLEIINQLPLAAID